MEARMNTVTLSIVSREDVTRRALAAFNGERQGAHISFESVELLWQTLTRKRWELLKAMTGQSAMTIREAARRVTVMSRRCMGMCRRFSTPAFSTVPPMAALSFPTTPCMSISP